MELKISHTIKQQIARNFSRAAATYNQTAILQQEVGSRLLERLDLIKIDPKIILDMGSGTGFHVEALAKRYPTADILQLDIAKGMIDFSKESLPSAKQHYVCADGDYCPLKNHSIDFVFSNCALQWFFDPQFVLAEMRRILKPGGLLLFSTYGPDTLKELRDSYAAFDAGDFVNTFLDMHDIGDLCLHADYSDPVMDMETLTLTYKDVITLLKDLKFMGSQTIHGAKPRGLATEGRFARLQKAYELHLTSSLTLPATFEIIYGHAWIPLESPLHRADNNGNIYIPIEHIQYLK